ncbi:MAG TPA: AfsR/SARP family transcriptional regulator [Pseudonocardia sp.]|nr:AfsR/SARP family transcriptional regulator [Pseudonocardia sp.]
MSAGSAAAVSPTSWSRPDRRVRTVAPGQEGLCCCVLGPLECVVDGVAVHPGGPSPRRLLAALSAARGVPVADSTLVELVWRGCAPPDALSALRVLVSRLRSALGSDSRSRLRREVVGYSLDLPDGATDHGRFRTAVELGRRRLADGRPREAIGAFDAAQALWRGQPWPELEDAPLAIGARAGLVELLEVAVEEGQAAQLELGDAAYAVATLSAAVITAPYRERRWELLALGLYRSARQAEALWQLRRARTVLVELGRRPGPALGEMERRILAHDPTLEVPGPAWSLV